MTVIYVATNEIATATIGGDTPDALFPASHLGTGAPEEMFRFDAAGLDDFVSADLGSAKNPNFASIHFHNIDDAITVKIQSDDNAGFSTPTDRVTLTKRKPAFFGKWTGGVADRYWRILFEGTNSTPIYIGEWVLGTSVAFTSNQLYGWTPEHMMPQQRTGSFPGKVRAVNYSEDESPIRRLTMQFKAVTASERDEGLAFFNAGKWGASSLVLVPDDTDSIAIHGVVANTWSWPVDEGGLFPYGVVIEEDPGPVLTK